MADEYITLTKAREMLGVSRPTIVRMIRDGDLHLERDPRDARLKLVKRSEVEALMRRPHGSAAPSKKTDTDSLAIAV